MKVKAIHYHNPTPGLAAMTPCGRSIRKVQWTFDEKDVTCNNCLRALQ